jgi:DNA-binding CsgD family transcriptional regulator
MNQLTAATAPASPLAAPLRNNRPVPLRPGLPLASLSGDNVLQMLELLPQALLVVQGDRTVLMCNRRAHGMSARHDIRLVESRLAGVGQLGELQVHQALQNACTTGSCDSSLWFQGDLATGWMRITALPAGTVHNPGGAEETLLVVVQLDQPALTQAARIDALARHSRLSAAERHVLMLLGDGMTVEIAATHLGLCLSTLRSHVRNLLGKTQASSLMQLLRWVGSGRPLPH